MRREFEMQLKQLNNALIEMGVLAEQAIEIATKAFIDQDVILAKEAIALEVILDEKESDIEKLCFDLLWRQQPVASDLRLISSVLKMITDLERIGDQASDIAEITILLANEEYLKELDNIKDMALATTKMVTESVDAFVTKNLELAQQVIEYDDVVDNLFDTIKSDLIELIKKGADDSDQAIDLIIVAKYYERIGDHATNIAEWVVFSLTGQHKTVE